MCFFHQVTVTQFHIIFTHEFLTPNPIIPLMNLQPILGINFWLPKNTLDTVPTDVENKRKIDWTSSSSKLHYAPHVLNTLHFPSLTRLDIGFPPNLAKWNGRNIVDPSAFRVAFPMFAIEADNLCNVSLRSSLV